MMIVIGCDHAGYPLKVEVAKHLTEIGVDFIDVGCNGESCDYPIIAKQLCDKIVDGTCTSGLLFCGTGVGMSMCANKVDGIRACVCSDYFSARLTRMHNDANVLCLGARVVGVGTATDLVDVFLNTEFEGGRHQRRVDLIADIEKNN
jgi:ribose 5-phosphate isomerase B